MNPHIVAFLGKSILKYRGIKITFVPKERIKCMNSETVGWATDTEIRIATKLPLEDWLGVFVHETCHVDQSTQRKKWHSVREDAVGSMDTWLSGKQVNYVDDVIRKVVELEWDCEKRSLRKIIANKLPIDIEEYSQKANAYIIGYNWTYNCRKWCKFSYNSPDIWKAMPKKIVPLQTALYPPTKLTDMYYD